VDPSFWLEPTNPGSSPPFVTSNLHEIDKGWRPTFAIPIAKIPPNLFNTRVQLLPDRFCLHSSFPAIATAFRSAAIEDRDI
jgi:hypothetical protein